MITAGGNKLSRRTLVLYALPTLGMTMMHWLIMVFLLKYSTDTIGVAPVVVGLLFAAGRLWDAASDPVAGWASDRTRSRFGRRRPWMIFAAIPLALAFAALWNPPTGLGPERAPLWLGCCLFLFFGALTASRIPYLALGAELTMNHHERTRLSAARIGAEIVGIFCAMGALHAIENAASTRQVAGLVATGVGILAASCLGAAGLGLKEVAGHQGRGAMSPLAAVRDVMRNPHARRLTAALVFAELGLGSLLVAIPFITEHFGQPGTSAIRILGFIVPFALAVPLWIPLSRRFGKARCYTAASGLCAAAFLLLGYIGFESLVLSLLCMLLIGVSQAALRTFPDSIKADIVDWDEAHTGERKEGAYFAAWDLADKAAGAISVGLVGFAIQGAEGGISLDGIKLATSTLPAVFLLLAMLALLGFRLDAGEHARLRARIDTAPARPARERQSDVARRAAAGGALRNAG
jgi:GPH family glycoside/pentoside/hexuronide:cation symporter